MRVVLLIGAVFASCTPKAEINEEVKLSNTEIKFVSDEIYHKNQAIIDSLYEETK